MKCRVCRGPAVVDIPRHNANFCAEHLVKLCRDQVVKAIADHGMLTPGERVLVAVSGGKDSLALWDLLVDLGYEADGLYVGLGIGGYSDASAQAARSFAAERGLVLRELSLREDHGYDVPTAAAATRRVPCSSCGLSKRHLFDSAARDGWVRGGRHRSQPGRRGRCPVRQHAALGPRVPRPATAGAAGARRLPPQGEATGPPERAGDGGLLHRARDRLPGGGVPPGCRKPAPRVQGGAEHRRGSLTGDEGRVLSRLPRPHGAAPGRAVGGLAGPGRAGRAAAVLALRLPDDRARCARSAAWSSGPRPTSRSRSSSSRSGGDGDGLGRRVRVRGQGPGAGRQGASLPDHPQGGRGVPHARRVLPARRSARPARGHGREGQPRRPLRGAAPDARGLRGRDAPRGPGHLPEGPRAHPHAGRHRAWRPGARVRGRVGRALDDDAAGRAR